MTSREWSGLPQNYKDIIARHQANVPIPLGALAEDLGLIVKSSTLEPGISGEIKRFEDAPSGYMVRVNRHESKVRQRFSLAHEIAHYLLHRDDIGDGLTDDILYRSKLSDAREAEANRLAADILMPWIVIEDRLRTCRHVGIEERIQKLADDLAVSTTAMEIRLGKLK